MGLVNELQECVEKDDVQTVLRKARRLATKLNRNDISEWLDHEQNGYPDKNKLPSYRQIRVAFYYNTNGYVPAGFGMAAKGIAPIPNFDPKIEYPVTDAIGTVMSWLNELSAKGKGGLYRELEPGIAELVRREVHCSIPGLIEQFSFLVKLDDHQVSDIPEQVKNRVLEWALKLESSGIAGENQSFTTQEKSIAQRMTFNLFTKDLSNHVTVAGNVQGAIQVASPHASQHVTIHPVIAESISAIRDAVSASGLDPIDKSEISGLLTQLTELAKMQATPKTKMKIHEKLAAVGSIIMISKGLADVVQPYIDKVAAIFS